MYIGDVVGVCDDDYIFVGVIIKNNYVDFCKLKYIFDS